MFNGIRVTIAEDDSSVCAALTRVLEGMGFEVKTARSVREALGLLPETDILSLDWRLNSGEHQADVVLDQWVAGSSGPVCIVTGFVDNGFRDEMLIRGAYNVLGKPVPMNVYQSLMVRYGRMVNNQKALDSLKTTVERHEKRIRLMLGGLITLGLITAAAVGPEYLDQIKALLLGLIGVG